MNMTTNMTATHKLPGADLRGYRAALGNFGTGVAVVTAEVEGELLGMTINSFASVSLEPALVLWSIADRASNYDLFCEAEHFAIHVLEAGQRDLSNRFAQSTGDKYADLQWYPDDRGTPYLPGCLARFQCRRFVVYPGGDHRIIVGEVEHFEGNDGEPLMFVQGQYLESVTRLAS